MNSFAFKNHKYGVGLALLMAITLILLFIGGQIALSSDEASMFLMYWGVPIKILLTHYSVNDQHTLYILISRMFMNVLGDHEYTFRLPALLLGILSIPLIFHFSRLFGSSKRAALLTAFFLTFSWPHFEYSILGRGYGLSMIFSIAIIIILFQMLKNTEQFFFGFLLFFLSVGMILAVPTNIHFMVSVFLFFLVGVVENRMIPTCSVRGFKTITPFLLTFLTIGIYFLLISSDLKRGILTNFKYAELYKTDFSFNLLNLGNVFLYQIEPWGGWFYILVLIGFLELKNGFRKIQIALIFFIPIVASWIIQVLGPPRIFIFWLPFILFLAGMGTEVLLQKIRQYTPLKKVEVFLGLFIIGMVIQAKSPIEKFLKSRFEAPATHIEDVKQIKDFIDLKISMNTLIVLPFENRVLRYYTEKLAAQRMLNIINTGKLDKIIFIGHENTPWERILAVGGTSIAPRLVKYLSFGPQFGGIKTYVLNLNIKKFLPKENDPDYATHLGFIHAQNIAIRIIKSPNLLGNYALQVDKKGGQKTLVFESQFKKIKVSRKNTFILKTYARKHKQLSAHSFIFQQNAVPPGVLFLNVFSGVFRTEGSDINWQRIHPAYHFLAEEEKAIDPDSMIWEIMFFLFSIPEGEIELSESFAIEEEKSWFDGVQSFVLCPPEESEIEHQNQNPCGIEKIR